MDHSLDVNPETFRRKTMDPITAIGIATTAFNAIKKGIEFGKEIESMSSDIGRWMGAIGDIREAEKKAKNPPLLKTLFNKDSVEQEAIEAFAAKKKIEAMEYELKTFINFHYGPSSWNEILRIQSQIRKQRQTDRNKRESLKENIMIWILAGATVSIALTIFIVVLLNV